MLVKRVSFVLQILIAELCCVEFSAFAGEENGIAYRAAVVEYHPIKIGDSPEEIFNENANNYKKFIEKASEYYTDIIVFPESGLTNGRDSTNRDVYPMWSSFIPDPKNEVNPCTDNTDTLEAIKIVACAARNNSIYVIINVSEKVVCAHRTNCSDDGYLFYNTNVVFDRNGTVIARYRKYNLFGEVGFNRTEFPELTIFETDFGVTFGVFIAFDMIFKEPSLTLVRKMNITDFVYSIHWYSALPFMTAVQTEMAWSYTMDVNLLASGCNDPIVGSGGSGIFGGRRGTMASVMPETNSNILIVADVPARTDPVANGNYFSMVYNMSEIVSTADQNASHEITLRRDNLEPYTTLEIDPRENEHDVELCDRGLCCQFYLKTSITRTLVENTESDIGSPARRIPFYYRYRLAVFNGVRDYSGIRTGGIQTCGIFACINDTLASCGRRLPSESSMDYVTRFDNITIVGDFPNDEEKLQIVETLTHEQLLPLQANEIFLEIDELVKTRRIKFQLIEHRNDILTFAIYGRNFATDGSDVTKPGNDDFSGSGDFSIHHISVLRIIGGILCELLMILTYFSEL
ncbi:vanin-like protein 1 isoform X1 [Athalia rosae]|uniref:vanin-like protein 1 isoform X1 n=2 Tax=Athalia rosae TaxID=37344 RepID=UPI002033DA18|nr:vanin-like protein 1 isoform X1 [Athalia rosae]